MEFADFVSQGFAQIKITGFHRFKFPCGLCLTDHISNLPNQLKSLKTKYKVLSNIPSLKYLTLFY
jgi:hypothetical protein